MGFEKKTHPGAMVQSEKPPRDEDSTLRINISDPKLEGIRFISPPLKLYSLRQHLSRFTLVHSNDPAGFSFENFRQNIRGIKFITLEETGIEVLFTRSSAFLTLHGPPGTLKRFSAIVGNDLFERANLAVSEDDQMLTICRITSKELKAILSAASGADIAPPLAGAGAPQEGDFAKAPARPIGMLPEDPEAKACPAELAMKLARCSVVSSEDDFDLRSFIERIIVVSVFKDEDDRGYYVIGLREEDAVYSLFVNVAFPRPGEQNPLVCTLKLGDDFCTIYRVNVID